MYVANYSRTFSFIKELLFNDDCLMLTFSNFILLSNCAHFSVGKYLDDRSSTSHTFINHSYFFFSELYSFCDWIFILQIISKKEYMFLHFVLRNSENFKAYN